MIMINKQEADTIRERYPNVHIVRTCKQKSKRHRYYCEEAPGAMALLHKLRGDEPEKKHFNKKNGKRPRRWN